MGKADVNVLLETIEKLKNKLKSFETQQPILNNTNQKELEKLKKEYIKFEPFYLKHSELF
jgi:flagellar motility protein MotE (MotC chaperone)